MAKGGRCRTIRQDGEVREMRNAETVLGILCECGKRGLPLDDLYRQLYNPRLYLPAYGRIYRNHGAMTPGVTAETVDGMSLARIGAIIEDLRNERFHWTPVRRVYIEKKHSTKKRPLGIPTWRDKLLQEVMRSLLEAYYEPQFRPTSHGFRPGRGCHTALTHIHRTWHGTTWFIEGDIAQCFDRLDHAVLLSILRERIHDNRFLRLVEGLLQAGYLEDWRYHTTLSGTPQGGVLSPLLANLYLDRLDAYVEDVLFPAFNRGDKRQANPEYEHVRKQALRAQRQGLPEEARTLRRQMQTLPSVILDDLTYRRLRYVRYADDFLLGFTGPREEAEEIRRQLGVFLQDSLKLELSESKTLITHARTQAACFLGYELHVIHEDTHRDSKGRRSINGQVGLRVPLHVIEEKRTPYLRGTTPIHRTERTSDSVFSIVSQFQQEYRGVVEYYRLAYNLHRFRALEWTMEQSLVKTLAHKLRLSGAQVYRRFQVTLQTDHGARRVLQVTVNRGREKPPLVAQWGDISLARRPNATLQDHPMPVWNVRTELEQRLLANSCELCGSEEDVEVHHVRGLKDLHRQGRRERPQWMLVMATRRRKTLVCCRECHEAIHHGQHDGTPIRETRHRRAV
jgi:group II intron reverse transcriptase/maturase